jgi:hypothetical protein
MSYPSDQLFEEVAYLAYYLHWPYDQIMGMEHHERRSWVTEVAKINRRLDDTSAGRSPDRWP